MKGIDKENLSKIKYIHYIHGDDIGSHHVEKYPVVYINSTYVYFRVNGTPELKCINLSSVWARYSDFVESYKECDVFHIRDDMPTIYCFYISDEEIASIINANKIDILINKIKILTNYIEIYNNNIADSERCIAQCKADIEKYEAQLQTERNKNGGM